MRKIFIAIVISLPIMAFATGAAFARTPSAKDDERIENYITTVTTVTEPEEPKRTYFDVPLPYDVQDHIFTECEKYNISTAIVIALIDRESKFNDFAIGDDGRSFGLMQIKVKCHLQRMIKLNCTNLFDEYQNITVGIDYLSELYNQYGCDYGKALTAYNRGHYSGTVTNYAKEILNNAKEVK